MKTDDAAEMLSKKWGCGNCGFENFGWRGTCRDCGKGAPAKWKKVQDAAQRQPKRQATGELKGKWANGPPRVATNSHENRALKQELEKLKAQLKELQPPQDEPVDNAPSKQQVQELEALVEQLKALGLPASEAEARLAEAKKRQDNARGKTPLEAAQTAVKKSENLFNQQLAKVVRLRTDLAEAESKTAKLAMELVQAQETEKEAVQQLHAEKFAPTAKGPASIPLEALLADTFSIDVGTMFKTGDADVGLTEEDKQILAETTTGFSQQLQAAAKTAFGSMVEQVEKAKAEHEEMRKRLRTKRQRADEEQPAAAVTETAAGATANATSGPAASATADTTNSRASQQGDSKEAVASEFMEKARTNLCKPSGAEHRG